MEASKLMRMLWRLHTLRHGDHGLPKWKVQDRRLRYAAKAHSYTMRYVKAARRQAQNDFDVARRTHRLVRAYYADQGLAACAAGDFLAFHQAYDAMQAVARPEGTR